MLVKLHVEVDLALQDEMTAVENYHSGHFRSNSPLILHTPSRNERPVERFLLA